MKLNTIMKTDDDSNSLRQRIDKEVDILSRIFFLGIHRYYYYCYDTVLNGTAEQIRTSFYVPDPKRKTTKRTKKGQNVQIKEELKKNRDVKAYNNLDSVEKIRDIIHQLFRTKVHRSRDRVVNVPGFDNLYRQNSIPTYRVENTNAFLALTKLYDTNVYNNTQKLFKQINTVFKYLLCKEIDTNVDDETFKELKKYYCQRAYETTRYLFKGDDDEDNNSDEDSDDDSIPNEEMRKEIDLTLVDSALILFVKEIVQPFDFDTYPNGKGVFQHVRNRKTFYRYLPSLIRLQKFVTLQVRESVSKRRKRKHRRRKNRSKAAKTKPARNVPPVKPAKKIKKKKKECNENKKFYPRLKTFVAVPTTTYHSKHIKIDAGALHQLYKKSELQPKHTYYNTFVEAKHEKFHADYQLPIPQMWFRFFHLERFIGYKKNNLPYKGIGPAPWQFASMTTNGVAVSVELKRLKESAIEDIKAKQNSTFVAKKRKKTKSLAVPTHIQEAFDNGNYDEVVSIDIGVRNIVSVTRRQYSVDQSNKCTSYENSFNIRGKDYHYWSKSKHYNRELKKLTNNFDNNCIAQFKKDSCDDTTKSLFAHQLRSFNPLDTPSHKTHYFERYVQFKLKHFQEGFKVYGTKNVKNLGFSRRLSKQQADIKLCKRVLGLNENNKRHRRANNEVLKNDTVFPPLQSSGRKLFLIGNGGDSNSSAIKGHIRSMGSNRFVENLKHIAHTSKIKIDTMYVNEAFTSKNCSRCFKEVELTPKTKFRQAICRKCSPNDDVELPDIVMVKPHKTVVKKAMNSWTTPKRKKKRHINKDRRVTISEEAAEKLTQIRLPKPKQINLHCHTRTMDRDINASLNINHVGCCTLSNKPLHPNFSRKKKN